MFTISCMTFSATHAHNRAMFNWSVPLRPYIKRTMALPILRKKDIGISPCEREAVGLPVFYNRHCTLPTNVRQPFCNRIYKKVIYLPP